MDPMGMDADHFVVTDVNPQWRRPAGRNDQHSVAFYALPGMPIPEVILVTGYNIMSDDDFMVELFSEFPETLIVFNSQVGSLPTGSEDRAGPGWRVVAADDKEIWGSVNVPFDDLAKSGISLY